VRGHGREVLAAGVVGDVREGARGRAEEHAGLRRRDGARPADGDDAAPVARGVGDRVAQGAGGKGDGGARERHAAGGDRAAHRGLYLERRAGGEDDVGALDPDHVGAEGHAAGHVQRQGSARCGARGALGDDRSVGPVDDAGRSGGRGTSLGLGAPSGVTRVQGAVAP